MKTLNIIALTLVIIGALNWGLIGIMNFNLVDSIFGIASIWSRTIYVLVGLADYTAYHSTVISIV